MACACHTLRVILHDPYIVALEPHVLSHAASAGLYLLCAQHRDTYPRTASNLQDSSATKAIFTADKSTLSAY